MLKMIHDLDEFLYPVYPDAENIMGEAAARAAVEDCGLKVSVAKARELIDRALHEKYDWMAFLIEEGIDPDELHDRYHKRLDHTVITPYAGLSQYFAALGDRASHAMLTHSSHHWASRVTDHIGLRTWFPDDRILAWEKYRAHKGVSTHGFEMAARVLQAPPQEIHFGDDNLSNVITAKKMGMTTIWASHGRPLPAGKSQYVDHIVGNMEIFMAQQVALLNKPSP